METDNQAMAREILQRAIGRRELRYGLMRTARALFGWPLWLVGLLALMYCGMGVVASLIAEDFVTMWNVTSAAAYAAGAAGGIGLMMMACGIATPYQFQTFMPGVDSERKCLSCGESVAPNSVFATCSKCGSWFPLDINSYIGRILSKVSTVINVVLILAGVTFAVVK